MCLSNKQAGSRELRPDPTGYMNGDPSSHQNTAHACDAHHQISGAPSRVETKAGTTSPGILKKDKSQSWNPLTSPWECLVAAEWPQPSDYPSFPAAESPDCVCTPKLSLPNHVFLGKAGIGFLACITSTFKYPFLFYVVFISPVELSPAHRSLFYQTLSVWAH